MSYIQSFAKIMTSLESVYTPKAYRGFESPSLRKANTRKSNNDLRVSFFRWLALFEAEAGGCLADFVEEERVHVLVFFHEACYLCRCFF